MAFPIIDGNSLLSLLGLVATDPRVQHSLAQLARGMQPELDPEDEEALTDWIAVNEIGLEYGFEDEAYVRAWELSKRRKGELLLSQLYFYGDTANTQPFPYPLPFGLTFNDDRAAVRHKLAEYEKSRRSYFRDVWKLPKFSVIIAYEKESGRLESVFCYLHYAPWPLLPDEVERVSPFTPELFTSLFGYRWSEAHLRAGLAPLGYEESLAEVRSEHVAHLRRSHGLELVFAPSKKIPSADQKFPDSLAFAYVTYYANRELDALQWPGRLPFGLEFDDTQTALFTKIGKKPAELKDQNLTGFGLWHFDQFTLTIMYSNLENRILRITLMAPGYWESTHNDPDE